MDIMKLLLKFFFLLHHPPVTSSFLGTSILLASPKPQIIFHCSFANLHLLLEITYTSSRAPIQSIYACMSYYTNYTVTTVSLSLVMFLNI